MTRRRPGFSLAEMMVALLLAGIIGTALARLIINQSRFVAMQDGMMRARSGTRAALNVLSAELRAVTDGGLMAATPDSIDLRVPYAFGVACQQSSNTTNVALLPGDSALFSSAVHGGYAWRDTTGAFVFEQGGTVSAGTCAPPAPAITVLATTGWAARTVAVAKNNTRTPVGAVVYLYQRIRYAFAPSATIPGRRALWRTVLTTGTRDELVVPFDSTSTFTFLVGNAYTLQVAPPAVLDSVRGVRIRLVGQSEAAPEGRSVPVLFDLTSDILFRNNARQ